MANGTRSGRVFRHEGTNSLRSESAVGKPKYIKGTSISGSTASSTKSRVETSSLKDAKNSTTSGSAAADSSILRRSTRETPSKKIREPSPILQKPEGLENEDLSTPSGAAATDSSSLRRSTRETPSKKMREQNHSSRNPQRLENEALSSPGSVATDSSILRSSTRDTLSKKMREQNPSLLESERLENEVLSSSSDRKKLEKEDRKLAHSPVRRSQRIDNHGTPSSSGSGKSKKSSSSSGKKKRMDDETRKLSASATGKQRKNKISGVKSAGLSTKKRMNARCYRALLLPLENKAKISDVDSKNLKDDSSSKRNSCHSGSIKSADSKNILEDGVECNGRKGNLMCKHSEEDIKGIADSFSCGSRELVELSLQNNEERKSSRLIEMRKVENGSPSSYCNGSYSESAGADKVSNGEDGRLFMNRLNREELKASELVDFTCERETIAPSIVDDSGGPKSEKLAGLDSDILVTPVNNDFINSDLFSGDAAFPSPFGINSEIMKQCTVCCRPQRVCGGSGAQELCLCNLQMEEDVPNLSSEKTCNIVSTLRSPCHHQTVPMCSQENKVEGDQKLETKDYLTVSEKQNCTVTSVNTNCVSSPVIEDRGRLRVDDGIGITAECLISTNLKETSSAMQTVDCVNACVFCNLPGLLLCCAGKACKRRYHLSCLNPPLQEIPPGVWLCHYCVKKKLESGIHSVSEGIESIWDFKEEMQNGKQYFVKYKALAHIHNMWIPESQLLLEAPALLSHFNKKYKKGKVTRWKQEWSKPHRLLQKRLLMPRNLLDEYISLCGDKVTYCYHEWLVKWKTLGYESASWEPENSPFLCTNESAMLIKDYEHRHELAKKASDPLRAEKALQVKKDPFHKLTRLPDEWPAGLNNDHMNSINRLREFWHESKNAVFMDDQERIIKSVLFLAVLLPHTTRPFLVISSIASLSLWESEFIRLAPSLNVVVYNGTKDIRKMIRSLEFYEEGGCIMFEVLLSHPDAIIEDFEAVDCIGWEAALIDECQSSRVSKHLQKLKYLSTDFRVLLLSAQLKDTISEYVNFLSFLESGGKENGTCSLNVGSNDATGSLSILKDRLARYLAYERKPDSGKFVEYWVPVRLSNVQLEQYCATLVSNSITLRSSSKNDHVGALRDILISTRKCCDHPYLVDKELPSSLTKGLPEDRYLDIGVKASGKLLLLDKVLQEIKSQGLRVLILFQSIGGAGRNPIGDILDDFIRQRFGADSFERIDGGLISSKKLAALNMFNDKTRGRFVFLIENRACLSSVKLSSVDGVIIYDSDWNPLNDLRALQRITFESDFEHVKVFRLYSCCTLEEKVLIFAKQDMILESNIQNVSRSNSHLLLSWGAFYLFSELDLFHRNGNPNYRSEVSTEVPILNDAIMKFTSEVMSELLAELPKKDQYCNTTSCSILVKAIHHGASYSRITKLAGEKCGMSSLDTDPPCFWSTLLEKRKPKWRFVLDQSQRSRKRPQHFGESMKVAEAGNNAVRRKHRKLSGIMVDPISLQTCLQDKTKGTSTGKDCFVTDCRPHTLVTISPQKTLSKPNNMLREPEAYGSQVNAAVNDDDRNLHNSLKCDDSPELHNSPAVESERREKLCDAQRNLHLLMKPELAKLCDVLKLPEDVQDLAQRFLKYIMNNLHVSRQSEAILQALKLSVCWRAASILKHKLHHMECLAIAKKYLNYACEEEQALSVYSKLRMLKKTFCRASSLQNKEKPKFSQNQSSASIQVNADQQIQGVASNSGLPRLPESGETKETAGSLRPSQKVTLEPEQAPGLEFPSDIQENLGSLKDVLIKKIIDENCSRRAEELLIKQEVELSYFNVRREEERMKLNSAHDSDLDLIRSIHIDYTTRNKKMKLLNEFFPLKMAEYDQHMKSQHSKLAVMQEDARNREEEIRHRWLEEAKGGTLPESFDNLTLTESGFRFEELKAVAREVEVCNGSGNSIFVSRPASDQVCSDMTTACDEDLDSSDGRTDVAVETKVLACESYNMVHLGCAKPDRALGLRSASGGICNDMVVTVAGESTESSANGPEIPPSIPSERFKDVLESENTASLYKKTIEAESIEPSGTSSFISLSLPPRKGDIPMETETLPSKSCIMSAEFSGVDAVRIESAIRTTPVGDKREGRYNSNNTCLISYPLQIQAELRSNIIDAVSNGPASMVMYSTVTTTMPMPMLAPISIDRDPHEGDETCDEACSLSSLRHNQEVSAPIFPSSGCEVSVPSNLVYHDQISSLGDHEMPAGSVSAFSDLEGTFQQIAIPAVDPVHVAPPQVEPDIHDRSILNSTLFELPAYIDISLTENGRGNSPVVLSEHEPCTEGTNSSAPRTELSSEQSIADAAIQADLTNQLVPESGPSTIRPERILPDHLVSSGARSDPGSLFLVSSSPWIPPQVISSNPLQNELTRIHKQDELCSMMHEEKKLQLTLERDQEIQRIKRKYEVLLQDAETAFNQDKKILETVYNKVLISQVLGKEFRTQFIENKGEAASFTGPRPSSSTSFPDFTPNPVGPRAVSSVPSGPIVHHRPPVRPMLQARPHITPVIPPHTSHQLGIEPRAPAPHLRFTFTPRSPMPATNQVLTSQASSQLQCLSNLGTASGVPGSGA